MENINRIIEYCKENKFRYNEDMENGVVFIKNVINFEGSRKAKVFQISVIEVMNMDSCYLEEYLKNVNEYLTNFSNS